MAHSSLTRLRDRIPSFELGTRADNGWPSQATTFRARRIFLLSDSRPHCTPAAQPRHTTMAVDILHFSSRRMHSPSHLLRPLARPPFRDAQRSGTTSHFVGAMRWHFSFRAELGERSTLGHRYSNRRELYHKHECRYRIDLRFDATSLFRGPGAVPANVRNNDRYHFTVTRHARP